MGIRYSALALLMILAASSARADETRFLTRVRQLTLDGRRAGEGYYHPGGDKMIFQSERDATNPFYQIYILDFTTGDVHRVSPGTGKTTCSFFRPGSDRVLFASTHLDPKSEEYQRAELDFRASGQTRRYSWDYDEQYDIFEVNQDGSEPRRLTSALGYDAEGSYSPDGSKIAFTSIRDAYPIDELSADEQKLAERDLSYFAEIYIMNADGTGQQRLTTTPGYDGGPFFSPDGERIIWRRFDEEGLRAEIYTMKLDGSDVRTITNFKSMSWAPYFHPSGDYIIFASNKLGFENFELYMVDGLGEKEPVRVSYADGFDGLPVFSPDGKNLCWTSTRHGGGRQSGQLFLGRWNDAEARKALAEAPMRGSGGGEGTIATGNAAWPEHDYEASVNEADLRAAIEYLASDELAGRLTGTPGEQLAADYIEARFKEIGLEPLDSEKGFQIEFDFTAGFSAGKANALEFVKVDPNPHALLEDRLKDAKKGAAFEAGHNFDPLAFSDEGLVQGEVAFAGYGLVVPGDDGDVLYDSYQDLDVEGRIVMVLRYVPEGIEPEVRQVYNHFAGLRYKALQARERGAVGILVVAGPNSPNSGKLVPIALDAAGASSGIAAASIDTETAEALLGSAEKTLKELQTDLDGGEYRDGLILRDTVAKLTVDLIKERRTGRNVVGVLAASGGSDGEAEFVSIGAHYDHLGRGGTDNSLARKGEENAIHHGADDNASGVAAILEVAERMAASDTPRNRGVIFAAWSGEEIGMLGSANFTLDPPVDLSRIVANLNLDMVGRVEDNRLGVQGVGSSDGWRRLLERKNIVAGFNLKLSNDPYLPTDSTSFYLKGIPGLHFFSGAHEDYHRPTDTADKINYEDLVRTAEFVDLIATDLAGSAERPAYAKVERETKNEGGRDGLRLYLGTIPDYVAEDVKGVKLSGVGAGGPADKAGLKGDDVIIELAGQKIANIYDYTYALDALKLGVAVKIKVRRGEEIVELTITPEGRE